jgi:hypothetical protein
LFLSAGAMDDDNYKPYDPKEKTRCRQCSAEVRKSNMSRHLATHSSAQPSRTNHRSRSSSARSQTSNSSLPGGLSLEELLVAERAATLAVDQHDRYDLASHSTGLESTTIGSSRKFIGQNCTATRPTSSYVSNIPVYNRPHLKLHRRQLHFNRHHLATP